MSQPTPGDSPTNFLTAYDAIPSSGLAPADGAKAQYQLLVSWLTTKPGQLFAELREQRPVLVPPSGPVLVTRFADVAEALDLVDIFTVKPAADAVNVVGTGAPFLLGMDDTPERERDQSILRLAVKRTDSDWIRSIAAEESKSIIAQAGGALELVKNYSGKVPLRIAGQYFGVPGPTTDTLRRWLRAMFRAVFRNPTHDAQINQDGATQAAEYRNYVASLVAAAHAETTAADSVLTRLVAMQKVPGASFTDEEITFNLSSLLMGMIDTTSSAANAVIDVLLDRPDQLQGAQTAAQTGDDALLLRYLFEAMRFNPPVPLLVRTSVTSHTFGNGASQATTIPAGKLVYVAISSAMMDEREITNPLEFRLDRPLHQYLHLGWGMHQCFGKYIAQTMLTEMIKAIIVQKNLRRATGTAGRPTMDGPFLASFTVNFDR